MSKMITWLSIMGGISLFLYVGGVLDNTVSSTILTAVLNPDNLQNTPLVTKLASLTTVVVGILSAFALRNLDTDFALIVPVVLVLLTFGWDFLVVFQTMAQYGEAARLFAVFLYGPFMLMYVVSVIEWWRGVSP